MTIAPVHSWRRSVGFKADACDSQTREHVTIGWLLRLAFSVGC